MDIRRAVLQVVRIWLEASVEETRHQDRLFCDILQVADDILRLPAIRRSVRQEVLGWNPGTPYKHETCPKRGIAFSCLPGEIDSSSAHIAYTRQATWTL